MQKCTRKCRNVQGPHNKEKEIAVCSKIWFSSFWTSTSFPFSTNFCQKRRNHFNLQPSNLPSVCCFVWFWPFDVSPVFVFLAPRDAGLEKVMLTFTFPALITVTVGAKSTRSDFLWIFALVAGNENTASNYQIIRSSLNIIVISSRGEHLLDLHDFCLCCSWNCLTWLLLSVFV